MSRRFTARVPRLRPQVRSAGLPYARRPRFGAGAPLDEPGRLLGYDLRLVAGLTWLALALVLWTGASLAVRIGRRYRTAPAALFRTSRPSSSARRALTNTFLNGFVFLGAAASLLAW